MLRIEILHDVVGTSRYRCGVLRSFPVERIEPRNRRVPFLFSSSRYQVRSTSLSEILEVVGLDPQTEVSWNEHPFYTNRMVSDRRGITSIMVNGKNAYELKGKFLDDLHKNAFSGTNREDAVEHIKYFLKIVDPIDLPNVNQDKLKRSCFPNLIGALWDYWKLGINEVEPANEKTLNLEETNQDDEQEIEWPTCSWREDGYCDRGNLPGAYIVGNTFRYQDLELYDALKDNKLKKEALKNKAIMEGIIDDNDESSDDGWKRWDGYEITNHD
ncbi:hypothetical protein Tco_1439833 [Tanacetum coccineum]